ncbi:MAG: glycoside hydrolase family 43 protein [Lachnospiraceae bacterium]|jgi:beta-xylosidase|nr:glycoside hydrolase family 43 protein [Lachnospiraceae bacterium]
MSAFTIRNPVIPGFYPDPTICRVGQDFYLACSSFELCPGIPVFHSRDLAHWEQISNALTAENGFQVEKNSMVGGVMAPTLRYRNGVFYLIVANFSDRGNCIVTAADPAGPWSAPHWLDDVPGIDASLFFDRDGSACIMGTGDVWDNGAGKKERGIWLAAYDIEHFRMKGSPVTIFNSALRVGSSPEAPHLYHIGDWYYLLIAEGGTEHYHAVMCARSRELFGFYEGDPANPVLTHRHMGFGCPILNVGHADLVELEDGSRYAVMLASRLLGGSCKNLGRETFLCPVVWERDWPLFSPETGKVEWQYDGPASLEECVFPTAPSRDDFDTPPEDLSWISWGTPYQEYYTVADSFLSLRCLRESPVEDLRPMAMNGVPDTGRTLSFLGKRQCGTHVRVGCRVRFVPENKESSGLAVIQSMNHQFHLELARENGVPGIRVLLVTCDFNCPPFMPGFRSLTKQEVIAFLPWTRETAVLQIEMQEEAFTFRCGTDEAHLSTLAVADGRLINPEKVGCMSGTIVGMFATANGEESTNRADFDWFEMVSPS